jgi:hypothetical protein
MKMSILTWATARLDSAQRAWKRQSRVAADSTVVQSVESDPIEQLFAVLPSEPTGTETATQALGEIAPGTTVREASIEETLATAKRSTHFQRTSSCAYPTTYPMWRPLCIL